MTKFAIAGKTGKEQGLQLCNVCGSHCPHNDNTTHCPTCFNDISLRKHKSLQKTWAFLITALIFIVPANLYPITYLLKNSTLYPDTIFTGIITLIDGGMPLIALIVFVASILVPVLKVLLMMFILLCIQRRWQFSPNILRLLFSFIDWVGRWSILDLFVISIMVAIFDKGNFLSVYPGIAATSFTIVVLSTLMAAHSFDTRFIWDTQSNAAHQQEKYQEKK